ncbi:hypothetical protein RMCBS344292_04874 [Rhizopus microsporus]|nr:hypothetical protein RMCBS344292_04874 [Rhizopus microsporus]
MKEIKFNGNQHARLFQQSEIITQQIRLVDSNLQTQGLPKITNETFWSHLYRKVAVDPNNLNAVIRFSPHILNNFNDFKATRREPGLDTYRYAIPTLDPLHRSLSNAYGSTIVQNVTMHFLNTKLWTIRIFKGYFFQQQQLQQRQQQPQPQQRQ